MSKVTQFSAVVISEPLSYKGKFDIPKSNGALYNLHQVEILEGPFAGKKVLGNRTILNKNKQEKSPVGEGQEITVHLSVVEDESGKRKPFWEIQSGVATASDDDILAIYDKM